MLYINKPREEHLSMDNEQFFITRLIELRKQKGVSARDMSLSAGQNANYVNHIERGKMLPSMTSFFALCGCLGITPKEFFDADSAHPAKLNALIENLKRLDEEALDSIMSVVERMLTK
jgi:transcriptional regulator with XRE-family HTH domain